MQRGRFSLDGTGLKVMFALDIPTVELGLIQYCVIFESSKTNVISFEVVSESPMLDIYCFLWKYYNSQAKWMKRFPFIFPTILIKCILSYVSFRLGLRPLFNSLCLF